MKKTIKKIAATASIATMILSMSSVALAENEKLTSCIDLRTQLPAKGVTNQQVNNFFAGKILNTDGDRVYIEQLFYFDTGVEKSDKVYISIDKSDDNKYTEGYIISFNIKEVKKDNGEVMLIPVDKPEIEENQIVTICGLNENTDSTTQNLARDNKSNLQVLGNKNLTSVGESQNKKYFAGKILEVKGNKVLLGQLFYHGTGIEDNDRVFVTIEDESKYPIGYLMSFDIKELKEVGNEIELIPTDNPVVEEDKIVTISSSNETLDPVTTNLDSKEDSNEEVSKGMFAKIGEFFSGIITAITGWFK